MLENLQRSYLQTTYQRQFTGVGPQGEARLDDYSPGYRPYSAVCEELKFKRTRDIWSLRLFTLLLVNNNKYVSHVVDDTIYYTVLFVSIY